MSRLALPRTLLLPEHLSLNDLLRAGSVPQPPAPPFDPNWFHSYQLGGVMPSVVLDFVGQRYWDGTNNKAAVASMVSGGTIDANGLLLNASIPAIGPLLAALAVKPALICVEVAGGVAAANAGIVGFGVDSPVFQASTNAARSFKQSGTPTSLSTANVGNWTLINRVASSVVATGRSIALNGGTRVSDTNIYAAPASAQLGFTAGGGTIFGGHLRAIYVINASVTLGQQSEGALPPAWAGSNALNVTGTNSVNFGNILQFERTQPWSFGAAILGLTTLGATANVLCTNVATASAFPGIDYMWIDAQGHLHVRLINNITSNFIGVFGSSVLNDNKPHYLFATYDGSGLAAGVKLYVDGVPETLNIESDTLNGLSTVAAGQDLFVGNQANHTDFVINCTIDSIRMSNIVRSPAYIAAHNTPATVPAIDANTIMALDFEEGTGTTTADLSASGFIGTLSAATLWARS